MVLVRWFWDKNDKVSDRLGEYWMYRKTEKAKAEKNAGNVRGIHGAITDLYNDYLSLNSLTKPNNKMFEWI